MQNPTKTAESDWLTPAEAALDLNVSPKTLARMADAGEIESMKLPSGHRRYKRRAVADMQSSPALAEGAEARS